jgi:NMD protein affecting ribosome stability and mRNA decay
MAMGCPNCGAENPQVKKFCGECESMIVLENQPQSYIGHAQAYYIQRRPKGSQEDITI